MPGPSVFRELISGRRGGPMAMLSRAGLRVLEGPYRAAVRWRNSRYDQGRAEIVPLDVPVVSVGNITLGGTGKTPAVEWLARWFADQGVRVGLVSRGYGAKPGQISDEALELARKLPDIPHVLDPDRVRGARRVIREFACRLVLLDDAFQHRRIARDLDIVLVDALEPYGFGHVFPRGTLREPLSGWSRAGAIMLTRAELVSEIERAAIRERVRQYAARAVWVEATHSPQCLESAGGERQPLDTLKGKRIAAFCGIGNPAGFRQALAGCGFEVAAMREFADHFAYSAADIEALARWSDELNVAGVLCTCKDLVKITLPWPGRAPLWAVSSRLQITHGRAELEAALRPLAERAKAAF
ncbi:MAG: tetraacyldisaccharide 4'-kinase [Planctomycetia bacterium]|nr:tetraacyldisaccharide 4'-kinase [Planctomycetia bacterium]